MYIISNTIQIFNSQIDWFIDIEAEKIEISVNKNDKMLKH
jgi:hypothetical protein